MARLLVVLFLVVAGCTVTTTSEDANGNELQTPPFWKMVPGAAGEVVAVAQNGSAQMRLDRLPAGTRCEAGFGVVGARLQATRPGFRWLDPRPWQQAPGQAATQYIAGAAYASGVGTGLCTVLAGETIVVALTAEKGAWETQKDALYRLADSYRRKGKRDSRVFDASPLQRVLPTGKVISRDE